jgi:hypothetical protein
MTKITKITAVAIFALTMTGCGTRKAIPLQQDIGLQNAPSQASSTSPGFNNTNSNNNSNNNGFGQSQNFNQSNIGQSNIGQPNLNHSNSLSIAPLVARVVKVRNGLLFGLGTCRVTVEVSNSAMQPASGNLKVTFLRGNTPAGTPIIKSISLGGGGSSLYEFEDKKWLTNTARAEIEADTMSDNFSNGLNTGNSGGFNGY